MSAQARPQVIFVDIAELLAGVEAVRGLIPEVLRQKFALGFESLRYLQEVIAARESTLRKLRQLIFAEQSEKLKKVFPEKAASGNAPAGAATPPGPSAGAQNAKAKGHGRNGAGAYTGAQRIAVPHSELQSGCACPSCPKGKVYRLDEPGQILRVVGSPLLLARVYEPERWRCNLCGETFTAPLPPEAGEKKYDETAGSMIALAKYGSGVPFYRLEKMQASLGVPLPAATQWEIVAEVARQVKPAWESLLGEAAQGAVIHNDDTTMTVLSLEKENKGPEAPERKGVFTSGIVAQVQGRRVGLFFTGRKHAGERLTDLLKRRAAELGAPIQMCDALERNLPKPFKVILANCLAHGRRKFVDQVPDFPAECRYVLDCLAEVYHTDERAREQRLNPEQRLALHQAESGPVMEKLHAWLSAQFAEKKVEPNSNLGGAIQYMLDHWMPLTLFLRQAGAPLDNNICEQALKMAILHRKNALFYKTETGALVGDILMSLIHTCRLNRVNPFAYLTALQKHAGRVRAEPAKWLPWNYQAQLVGPSPDTG